MSLWNCRNDSTAALASGELCGVSALLDDAFSRVDEAVDYFEKFLGTAEDPAGRICGLITVKGRNLALGCYSLALDGLAQESGALLRPLLEVIELLAYVRDTPEAVGRLLDGKLPRAGDRAKKVDSPFHELRQHLNAYAAHLGFGSVAIRHLIDVPAGRFRKAQCFNASVLMHNLATLFVFTAILAREAAVSFQRFGGTVAPSSADSLINKAIRSIELGEQIVQPILRKRKTVEHTCDSEST